MPVRPLARFPDARLRLAAEPVLSFDSDLRNLAKDLLDTMRAAPGIGITAPHVSILKRVVVLQLTTADEPRTYINPVIDWASADTIRHIEGSVSMPGVTEEIERHRAVRIAYQDIDGNAQVEDADGLRSVCHQHEIDQLDGIFWLQRLSPLKRERLIKKYRKLERKAL